MRACVRSRVAWRGAVAAIAVIGIGVTSARAGETGIEAAPAARGAERPWHVDFGGAVAATEDQAAPPAAPGFLQSLEVTGFVDGYYGWNFNRVGPALLRNFDVNHNEFSLNMAEVAVEKKPSEASRAGFRIDFMAGQAPDFVNAFEPGGAGFMKYVEQAYVSYLVPVGKGLSFDFGKFVTPHGAEVIESKDNYNYSRGLLFSLAIPYYHMGARASYPVNDKVTLTGYLVNGWNNVRDNNSGKTVGATVALKPTSAFSFTQSYMVGPETAGTNDNIRHLLDSLASYTVSPKVTVLGNFDYGRDEVEGSTVRWYGLAAYLRYQGTNAWALTPRYEWFTDPDAFATGTDQTVQEITVTSEYKLGQTFISRLEYRTDFSDVRVFVKDDGSHTKTQSTLSVSVIYAFSSKQ